MMHAIFHHHVFLLIATLKSSSPVLGKDIHYFGDVKYKYQCQCEDNKVCNNKTGECPGKRCAEGWFGAACQYKKLRFDFARGISEWLFDGDASTCNVYKFDPIGLRFETSATVTWIRIVGSDIDLLKQTWVIFKLEGFKQKRCDYDLNAQVSHNTLDLVCPTGYRATDIELTGPGIGGLCDLVVCGGRNVLLGQGKAILSTTLHHADNALDGKMPADLKDQNDTFGKTCAQTKARQVSNWWEFRFNHPVDIHEIDVRSVDTPGEQFSNYRLANVVVGEVDEGQNFVHFERAASDRGLLAFTITPQPIWQSAKGLQIRSVNDNQLVLCDVKVYGEKICPTNMFGRDCERHCNCEKNSTCFQHSGSCLSSCRPGYGGEDCYTPCPSDSWGPNCFQKCPCSSGRCDSINGTCEPEEMRPDSDRNSSNSDKNLTSGENKPGEKEKQGAACPVGTLGMNCTDICQCSLGVCHNSTGVCVDGASQANAEEDVSSLYRFVLKGIALVTLPLLCVCCLLLQLRSSQASVDRTEPEDKSETDDVTLTDAGTPSESESTFGSDSGISATFYTEATSFTSTHNESVID